MGVSAAEGTHDNRQIIAMYNSSSLQDSSDEVLVPIKVFEVPHPLSGPKSLCSLVMLSTSQ